MDINGEVLCGMIMAQLTMGSSDVSSDGLGQSHNSLFLHELRREPSPTFMVQHHQRTPADYTTFSSTPSSKAIKLNG